jgi:hypothetical protein
MNSPNLRELSIKLLALASEIDDPELITLNQRVVGSSPTAPTNQKASAEVEI